MIAPRTTESKGQPGFTNDFVAPRRAEPFVAQVPAWRRGSLLPPLASMSAWPTSACLKARGYPPALLATSSQLISVDHWQKLANT
jgi:hypothetical protein